MSERTHSGYFLVVEGIDGSGSTTQAKRLVDRFVSLGHVARFTFEPSQGSVGRLLRSALEGRLTGADGVTPHRFDWATLALLFAADRLDHVASEVLPALGRGEIVVSDRYLLSSFVYQSLTAAQGVEALPWLRALNREAVEPDLCLVLDVPADVAAGRRESRGGAEELFEASELQRRFAAGYARADELAPGQTLRHVDGTGPLDDVTERLFAAVLARYPELGRPRA